MSALLTEWGVSEKCQIGPKFLGPSAERKPSRDDSVYAQAQSDTSHTDAGRNVISEAQASALARLPHSAARAGQRDMHALPGMPLSSNRAQSASAHGVQGKLLVIVTEQDRRLHLSLTVLYTCGQEDVLLQQQSVGKSQSRTSPAYPTRAAPLICLNSS